jgi:hypothetical protein
MKHHPRERQTLRPIDTPLRFDPEFMIDVEDPSVWGRQITMNVGSALADITGDRHPTIQRGAYGATVVKDRRIEFANMTGQAFGTNKDEQWHDVMEWDHADKIWKAVPELQNADDNEQAFWDVFGR